LAGHDEPEKIKIGGAGIGSLLLIPIVVFIFFLVITYIFPNVIPPGNLIITPKIDPASGQPLSLDPMASLIVSLINGTVFGSTTALIEVIYVVRRRSK
jgi:hypothetical protein